MKLQRSLKKSKYLKMQQIAITKLKIINRLWIATVHALKNAISRLVSATWNWKNIIWLLPIFTYAISTSEWSTVLKKIKIIRDVLQSWWNAMSFNIKSTSIESMWGSSSIWNGLNYQSNGKSSSTILTQILQEKEILSNSSNHLSGNLKNWMNAKKNWKIAEKNSKISLNKLKVRE